MMPTILLERLQLLLQYAKDPRYPVTANENLAAARELVDTAFHLEAFGAEDYRTLRMMCTTAALVVANSELERAQAAVSKAAIEKTDHYMPKTYNSFSDGIRAVQVAP